MMQLRRLLGLSAAVSGRLRRSYSTAASHPDWTLMANAPSPPPEPRAAFVVADPPRVSKLFVPTRFLASPATTSTGGKDCVCRCTFRSANSSSGLVLIRTVFALAQVPDGALREKPVFIPKPADGDDTWPPLPGRKSITKVVRVVCNPLSGQLLRLPEEPDAVDTGKKWRHVEPAFLTQAERGYGPPDRYAVAEFRGADFIFHLFLSVTGRWESWDATAGFSYAVPSPRPITADQPVVTFGGRMWWLGAWGAVSVDPFSDEPDFRASIVKLPSGSVKRRRNGEALSKYQRIGVSEGRLRYVEVSGEEPFVLSSFLLDDEGGSWTLEHRVEIGRLWAEPLQKTPWIGAIDPLNSEVMYLMAGDEGKHVIGVDMAKETVIGSTLLDEPTELAPLLLPPWLESSEIPALPPWSLRRGLRPPPPLPLELDGRLASCVGRVGLQAARPARDAPRATIRLANPPLASELFIPTDTLIPRDGPSVDANPFFATADVVTSNGLLLLHAVVVPVEARGAYFPVSAPVFGVPIPPWAQIPGHPGVDSEKIVNVARVVCNPLSGELLRLLDIGNTRPGQGYAGLLTQAADRGDGPPDRFAVAEVSCDDFVMHRFLSETGRWDAVAGFLSPLPAARAIYIDQPVVAFGGRMWWVDLGWGAVSVDPFADEPDFRFIKLPRGRVLPASKKTITERRERKTVLSWHRHIGVSEGRLRYVEVSVPEPFVLYSFVLDDKGIGWTEEYSTGLKSEGRAFPEMPRILCIDPLKASVVFESVKLAQIHSILTQIVGHEQAMSWTCGLNLYVEENRSLRALWVGDQRYRCARPHVARDRSSLRRLLRLATKVSGCLRRSHSTAASHPAWATVDIKQQAPQGAAAAEPRATFRLADPPLASQLFIPVDVVCPHAKRGDFFATTDVSTSNGFILLHSILVPAAQSTNPPSHPDPAMPQLPGLLVRVQFPGFPGAGREKNLDVTRVICNPLSGELLRLPGIGYTRPGLGYTGLLTQAADRGDGPPDRFALAEVSCDDFVMHRFLSETGSWDTMARFLPPLPTARPIFIDQPVLAFGGRMWWIDLGWGAVSVDPFADEPDSRFVELPRGRVLPATNEIIMLRREREMLLGWDEGRLRYVEVTGPEPFVLNSFVLDDEGIRWTLQYSTELKSEGRPFPEMPRISCIDPLNGSVVYTMVGGNLLFGVDMAKGMITGRYVLDKLTMLTPCVLPPWLESCRIPSTGTLLSKESDVERKTLADTLSMARTVTKFREELRSGAVRRSCGVYVRSDQGCRVTKLTKDDTQWRDTVWVLFVTGLAKLRVRASKEFGEMLKRIGEKSYTGLLTQANDSGDGPPDRYAVAELGEDRVMHRFLSETGRWDTVAGFWSSLPGARGMAIQHTVVAYGGRMWWIDLSWGVVSIDPFADEPDFRFVELPTESVLPTNEIMDKHGRVLMLSKYRRVGFSEGRLRYAEISWGAEPFLINYFVLDDDDSRWTLEHRLTYEPSWLWELGGYGLYPLETPWIGAIDSLNSHALYELDKPAGLTPCVLPPWLESSTLLDEPGLRGAAVVLSDPPGVSNLRVPAHLFNPRAPPAPCSNLTQHLIGTVFAVSGDGLILVDLADVVSEPPKLAWRGGAWVADLEKFMFDMEIASFVCNPLTGQFVQLRVNGGQTKRKWPSRYTGLITQSGGGRGHGPPDRYAVAQFCPDIFKLVRFCSEKGRWDSLTIPGQAPSRQLVIDQEVVSFGSRLWWPDMCWGVFSIDPFRDVPDLRFVELPERSVLPAGAMSVEQRWTIPISRYRRVGVSEGRLRYVEVSPEEQFVLRSFALDGGEGSGSWTLERQLPLMKLLEDGDYPWLPLYRSWPSIAAVDPLSANVVYITVGCDRCHVVGVDMEREGGVDREFWAYA
uniref:DUF1618 domain-containing protein n=1 Tax=Leersia perrieri TaxID=77586 RepID=A0A0D9WHI6_9ORYZ